MDAGNNGDVHDVTGLGLDTALDTKQARQQCRFLAQKLRGAWIGRFYLLGNAVPALRTVVDSLEALAVAKQRTHDDRRMVETQAVLRQVREDIDLLERIGWGLPDNDLRLAVDTSLQHAEAVLDCLEGSRDPLE